MPLKATRQVVVGGSGKEDYSGQQNEKIMFHGFWDTYLFGKPSPRPPLCTELIVMSAIAIKWAVFASFWHFGLVNGFREYMVAFVVMTVGYAMLACCLAELVSVIAFPGGYYGYARCTVHPFFGYLVGCSGVIETVFVTAATALRIAQAITICCGTHIKLEPLWWVLIHGGAILVHVQHHRVYWFAMLGLTALCVLTYIIFILGSIPVDHFVANVNIPETTMALDEDWLHVLSLPSIFYYGCDLVIVVADEVNDSKKIIPKAMLAGYATMAVVAVAIILSTVSQTPGLTGTLFTTVFPLSFGFANMLNVRFSQAVGYIVAPLLSSLLGYMCISGRMITSFAKSGLLPGVLKSSEHASPWAMVATSAVGLCLQAVAWTYDTGISFRAALHAAFFVYIGMCICYVVFKYRYGHLHRSFQSPFGIPGAILGFVIFTLALASMILSGINNIASCIYATAMGLFIIYWFLIAEEQQQFSPDEQQEFFKVYTINSKPSPLAIPRRVLLLLCYVRALSIISASQLG